MGSKKFWVFFLFFGGGFLLILYMFYSFRQQKHLQLPMLDSVNWEQKASDPSVWKQGEYQFKVRCSSCHGFDGKGGFQAPDLTDSSWQYGRGDFLGISYIIQNGSPSLKMPSWGHTLLQEDIVALTVYVHSLSLKKEH